MADTAEFIQPIELESPPPEASSVTSVDESELFIEEDRAPVPLAVAPTLPTASARPTVWQRLAKVKNKATLVAWAVTGFLGLLVVLQRNGALHSAAEMVGQVERYEALERDLVGGPGEGTVRGAKQRWTELVPEDSVPFSKVEERLTAER